MAAIVHVDIIGIRETEETRGDTTYNSTYYSVLVFFSDGSRKMYEGSAGDISWLLPYVKPRNDMDELRNVLFEFGKNLKKEMQAVIHSELVKAEMSRSPVPEITGMDRFKAGDVIREAGLNWFEYGRISESVSGTVVGYDRNEADLKNITGIIRYDFPAVTGMDFDSAVAKLRRLGFTVKYRNVKARDAAQAGQVLGVEYDSGTVIILDVGDLGHNIFSDLLKDETSLISIWKKWEASDLRSGHPKTSELIKKYKELERMYGKMSNIEQIKKELEDAFSAEA